MSSQLPIYKFHPELIFPETVGMRAECKLQSTMESDRKIAGLVLAICNLTKTGKPPNDLTVPQFHTELTQGADIMDVPLGRMIDWAGSVMLNSNETLSSEEMKAIPTRNNAKNFDLHGYQVTTAGWAARRLGSVMALGCGVGKTAAAIAAAIGAKRLGIFKGDRIYIVCPLNAMSTWRKAAVDLEAEFKDVQIVSVDSLHHYKGLTVADGGALIVDEAHRTRHEKTGRTKEAYEIRRCFEWATCLTGSLLHIGPEGLMTILDLACPGLSRFLDKWAFGEAFSCIAVKPVKIRGQTHKKHSLVIPGDDALPYLAKYLEPAVRSLSLDSPEVASVVNVPGQTSVLVDTWEKPDWVNDLFAESRQKIEAAARAPAGTVITGIDEILWAPDVPWQTLMGSLAVCIMEETREEIFEIANEIENTQITSIENAVKSIQSKLDDPFFREGDMGWLSRRKPLQAMVKNPGLPSFSKVLHAACRVGRYDQVIVKTTELVNGLKNVTWRFKYGPGHDRKNPGIGPKCKFALDWITENEKEPLVLGAAGKGSVSVIATELEVMKITHRIIRGGVPSKHREKFVDEFNAGDVQIMLVQQVAGSESIDLIRAATSMLIDHDWSASTYEQFLARVRRQGQTRASTHLDLSFTSVQTQSIQRLIRGRDFDAQTRALLEKECNMNSILSTLLRG